MELPFVVLPQVHLFVVPSLGFLVCLSLLAQLIHRQLREHFLPFLTHEQVELLDFGSHEVMAIFCLDFAITPQLQLDPFCGTASLTEISAN
jgi:hypothetical protein